MAETSVRSSRSAALRLSLACNLTEVRSAALAVGKFLERQGVAAPHSTSCELALVEACNNAICYATEPGRAEPVTVDVLCTQGTIELRINDHTPGFEWPAHVELPDPEQESGRGLFLIQSLMDRAEYFRGNGSNCLVMSKERSAFAPASATSGLAKPADHLMESEQIISEMADELSFCYESLSAIFRCSAELGRTNNLHDFSQRLLADLAQITSADWFVLRLLSKEASKLVVFTASEPMLQLAPVSVAMLGFDVAAKSAEAEAAIRRQDVWFDEQSVFDTKEPLGMAKPLSAGLIHPILFGERLIGTLAVGKERGRPNFTAVQANVVHTFADFLAIQIVNARFQEEQVNSLLVSRELEIAQNIQRSLLPKSLPNLPGCQLAGYCESARQVGGDFYDVIKLDDNSLLLVIADVMGKGIPAAMFAAILRSLLRAVPEWTNQPGVLLSRVNRLLFDELSGVDMFITAQLAFVDLAQKQIVAASAGHCPLLLARADDGSVKAVSPEGLPLGIMPNTAYPTHTEPLGENCRVLLYTDGVTEARSVQGEFFGQDRLADWFRSRLRSAHSATELKDDLAAELSKFQFGTTAGDDQTFLILA